MNDLRLCRAKTSSSSDPLVPLYYTRPSSSVAPQSDSSPIFEAQPYSNNNDVSHLLNACNASVRVVLPGHYGSGTIVNGTTIADRLPELCLLTNHHVIKNQAEAGQATVQINYRSAAAHASGGTTTAFDLKLLAQSWWKVGARDTSDNFLDYCVCAIEPPQVNTPEWNALANIRPLSLTDIADSQVGDTVICFNHSAGGHQQVAITTIATLDSGKIFYCTQFADLF